MLIQFHTYTDMWQLAGYTVYLFFRSPPHEARIHTKVLLHKSREIPLSHTHLTQIQRRYSTVTGVHSIHIYDCGLRLYEIWDMTWNIFLKVERTQYTHRLHHAHLTMTGFRLSKKLKHKTSCWRDKLVFTLTCKSTTPFTLYCTVHPGPPTLLWICHRL